MSVIRGISPIADNTYEIRLISGEKAEVGDRRSVQFKPSLDLFRWGEECRFRITYPTLVQVDPVIDGNKIKWSGPGIELSFYDLIADENFCTESGIEFEITLTQPPLSNQIDFEIEVEGLRVLYQPEETEDLPGYKGFRPDHIKDSYAFYHDSKKNNEYMAGKAFHFFGLYVTDSDGHITRASPHIDLRAGTISIIIPQDFLDNAVYPVIIDPTFGYEVAGGSARPPEHNWWVGSKQTSGGDAEGATVQKLSVYCEINANTPYFKGVICNSGAPYAILANGVGNGVAAPGSVAWTDSEFGTDPTISASTEYYLGIVVGDGAGDVMNVRYDAGDANQGGAEADNNYASPTAPAGFSQNTDEFSIYATYTVAGGVLVPQIQWLRMNTL